MRDVYENARVRCRKRDLVSDCSCDVHDLRFGLVDGIISGSFVVTSPARGGSATSPANGTAVEHFEPGGGNVEVRAEFECCGVSPAVGDGADKLGSAGTVLFECPDDREGDKLGFSGLKARGCLGAASHDLRGEVLLGRGGARDRGAYF